MVSVTGVVRKSVPRGGLNVGADAAGFTTNVVASVAVRPPASVTVSVNE